ncbi:MAG: RNA 2',3'-cyclic phosphodiesterase [Lachnospiraceae bacterium]|nr:RNA 2',3'-cyclic phosphodiesterase [Lachnospiraceae bacterium]
MRLFLAIVPDNNIKDELCMIQKRLQMQGVKGNYTTRENMHLTLAFIGEYSDPDHISDILSQIDFEPVRLVIDGFGTFGDTYWIGVKEDKGLAANVKRIRKALSDNGIPFDKKKFTPHMTIARKITYEKGFPTDTPFPAAMDVEYIALMRSDRGRNGMIYTVVDEYETINV